MTMFVVGLVEIWYGDRRDHLAALLALSSMILLSLETCPKCSRRVWKEGEGVWTFYALFPVKAFWIGLECRELAAENPPEKPR